MQRHRFEVGDRVTVKNSCYHHYKVNGTIVEIGYEDGDRGYLIDWDDGRDNRDAVYFDEDLKLIKKFKKIIKQYGIVKFCQENYK